MVELKDIIYYALSVINTFVMGVFSYLLWTVAKQTARATKVQAEVARNDQALKGMRNK